MLFATPTPALAVPLAICVSTTKTDQSDTPPTRSPLAQPRVLPTSVLPVRNDVLIHVCMAETVCGELIDGCSRICDGMVL